MRFKLYILQYRIVYKHFYKGVIDEIRENVYRDKKAAYRFAKKLFTDPYYKQTKISELKLGHYTIDELTIENLDSYKELAQ